MKFRQFSNLGWNVSEVGLGCWQIGWSWGKEVTTQDARDLLKKSLDKGVNFFDTSDMYGDGRSEKFIGEIIKSTSEKIYITTKLGRRVRGTNYPKGFKGEHMEEFVDRSLTNLGVECIDLVQLHVPPIEDLQKKETYEIMDNLVKKGKIEHYGVSVYKISDAMEAIKNPNVKSIQIVFNIFRQKPAEAFFKEAKKKKCSSYCKGPSCKRIINWRNK